MSEEFIPAIQSGNLTEKFENLLRPISCGICYSRFADKTLLSKHVCGKLINTKQVNPKALTVAELKKHLLDRGGSTLDRKTFYVLA